MNYYQILEIDRNASQEDIKNAYKKLALKWHPDKNKGNKEEAEIKFREMTKAYKILSDEESRKKYDKTGVSDNSGGKLFDPFAMYKEIFEEDNGILNIIVPIKATIDQLYTGFSVETEFIRYSSCEKCDETGTKSKKIADCKKCEGKGTIIETLKGGVMGIVINEKECIECEGLGIDPDVKKCKQCEGRKFIKQKVEYAVDVPAGAYDRYFVTLTNEGNCIPKSEIKKKSKIRSDVLFVVDEIVDPSSNIRRGVIIKELKRVRNSDVIMDYVIDFSEAMCGIKKSIDYIGGKKIQIETNEIIQNNDMFVLEGYGMPILKEVGKQTKTEGYGDLFIKFKVNKPNITKQQRKRIWQIITGTPYPVYDDDFDNLETIVPFEQFLESNKNDTDGNSSSNDSSNESSDDESSKPKNKESDDSDEDNEDNESDDQEDQDQENDEDDSDEDNESDDQEDQENDDDDDESSESTISEDVKQKAKPKKK